MTMSNAADGRETLPGEGAGAGKTLYKKEFWSEENLKYSRPHLRMEKVSQLVNKLAAGRERTLLDVGCGPATLMSLLKPNIHYYGIDIAIQEPAPNLIEADILEQPIKFGDKRFDLVVAQGFFEYVGKFQSQKFAEIAEILNDDGIFVASYVNFDHRNTDIYFPYSNVQPFNRFRSSLAEHFRIDRCFPTSYNWGHWEPGRRLLRAANMRINVNIPLVSRVLGVQYLLVCSPRRPAGSAGSAASRA
jgi:cyclopropane fatty-acyl-phospholipid synthase-like methyltransferase